MKALSIWPQWAAEIAVGDKTVECRSWKTNHRGPLLICASLGGEKILHKFLPAGFAVAVATLEDCVPMTDDLRRSALWPDDEPVSGFAWLLSNVRPIEPFPVKGRQNLFNVDADIKPLEADGLESLCDAWLKLGVIQMSLFDKAFSN